MQPSPLQLVLQLILARICLNTEFCTLLLKSHTRHDSRLLDSFIHLIGFDKARHPMTQT